MAKNLLEKTAAVLVLVSVFFLFPLNVNADVAPSPVETTVTLLPFGLIAAVAAAAVILLVKFFKKK